MLHDAIDRANDMTHLWWDCTQMVADVPLIITMRLMGLSGVWSVPDNEHHDMVHEKAPAFTESFISGTLAVWSGHGPDRVMQAAIEPISRITRDNRARLAGGGLRMADQHLVLAEATGSL